MRLEELRWIASDIDGTLLDRNLGIREEWVSTFRSELAELRRKRPGLGFSLISGRPCFAMKPYVERFGLEGPMVACNGAVLFEGDQRFYEAATDFCPLSPVLEDLVADGHTVLLYEGDTEYCFSVTEWVRQRRARGLAYPMPEKEERFRLLSRAIKVNVIASEESLTEGGEKKGMGVYRSLLETFGNRYKLNFYEHFGCEIVAKNCNKAEGIRRLATLLDISPAEILVIGDHVNDLEMFEQARFSAAVANATEDVKRRAAYVCAEKATLGVIEVLRKLREEAQR